MSQTTSFCIVNRCALYGRCALLGIALLVSPFSNSEAGELSSLRHTTTVQAIQKAEPAVVNIEGNKPAASLSGAGDSQQVNGMGAGVIIDPRGYILTNQHVVQDVGRLEVTLHSGRQYIGRLIARDPSTDLAMIKIDARGELPVIQCGTSSDLLRGEPVIAIGNPFGYHNTVTQGIISALHRDIPVNGVQDYPDLIQTDASINPGNSGGPLLNADGDMIGINAAVRIGAQGIGFAIPVDRAVEIAAEMIAQYRRNSFDNPSEIKTTFQGGESFLRVVRSTSNALKSGDVIRNVNGHPIHNRLDYELALLGQRSGAEVEVRVERQGEVQLATVLLNSRRSSNTKLASTGSLQEQVYRKFGVRLEVAEGSQVRNVDSSYKGGLRVTSVRKDSPAYAAQIQTGDILVGLLEWQTPDWDDLEWIMKSSEMRTAAAPKFHIMRDRDVFWGTLEFSGSVVR